jgi:Ino eighty subunit 2
VQNEKGTQLGVPDEWLQAPTGRLFIGDAAPTSQTRMAFWGQMVEEVD